VQILLVCLPVCCVSFVVSMVDVIVADSMGHWLIAVNISIQEIPHRMLELVTLPFRPSQLSYDGKCSG